MGNIFKHNIMRKILPSSTSIKITAFWKKICSVMFEPKDASSLAFFRITFGLLMALDIPHERGLGQANEKWSDDDKLCRFPLFDVIAQLPFQWMCIVYFLMWLGSLGIMLGFLYKISCITFAISYWYIVLLDKTSWNNHTYMFGLMAVLLTFTDSHRCWSLDNKIRGLKEGKVPFWNYFILRYQVFILYFMAGVKKMNYEWLSGYTMENISENWVFDPFKPFLTSEQIDYWIVHVFGFILDILSGFGICFEATRPITFVFLTMFHFMNSRLFSIGMFPYVCFANMFIFCDVSWPTKLIRYFRKPTKVRDKSIEHSKVVAGNSETTKITTIFLIFLYVLLQLFLPFSHFITKGYNGWTRGLYGYSWDMMVYNWDMSMITVKIRDNDSGREHYIDPWAWVMTDKWIKHPDMLVQYAQCVRRNVKKEPFNLRNISLYVDVWCSLNGRFHQRMIDPRMDLLSVKWSPFEDSPMILPLRSEYTSWRPILRSKRRNISQMRENTDVIFLLHIPGLIFDNFIPEELYNVTLHVLGGSVALSIENGNNERVLKRGEEAELPSSAFHHLRTTSLEPSCLQYIYINGTSVDQGKNISKPTIITQFADDIRFRFSGFKKALHFIVQALSNILITYEIANLYGN